MERRDFIKTAAILTGGLSLNSVLSCTKNNMPFKISLAEWSLNRMLFSGELDHLDFCSMAKNDLGINAVEYVNQFFFDKAKNKKYLGEMLKRSDDYGVKNLLIMIDDEGHLGGIDKQKRLQAIDNHKKWVEAASYLGCDHIRVNAQGYGPQDEISKNASESLFLLGCLLYTSPSPRD